MAQAGHALGASGGLSELDALPPPLEPMHRYTRTIRQFNGRAHSSMCMVALLFDAAWAARLAVLAWTQTFAGNRPAQGVADIYYYQSG